MNTATIPEEIPSRISSNLRAAIKVMLIVGMSGIAISDAYASRSYLDGYETGMRGDGTFNEQIISVTAPRPDVVVVTPDFSLGEITAPDFSNDYSEFFVSNDQGGGNLSLPGMDSAVDGKDCAANPIIPATGNKVEREQDFVSSGEMPLGLARTYNKHWPHQGIFGRNWVSNFDYRLAFELGNCQLRPGGGACAIGLSNMITALRPDGGLVDYIKNPADGIFYEDKAEAVSTIQQLGNGSFILTGEQGAIETYDPSGYIVKLDNGSGISWQYSYVGTYPHRVTHTSGRYVEFTWTNGRMTAVRDPAGSYYGYSYASNNSGSLDYYFLTAVSLPGNPASNITYHYDNSYHGLIFGALVGKSFNGQRYSTFAYDQNGRAVSSEHSGKDRYTFSYSPKPDGRMEVTETNPLGKQTVTTYWNGKLESVEGKPSTYCQGSYSETVYDANGYPLLKSDFNGNSTGFEYNNKGQLTKLVQAFGTPQQRTTIYLWDATRNRITKSTTLGVLETTYNYDGENRISSISEKNLLAPSTANNLNQVRVRTFSHTKHANGMLASVTEDGPLTGSGDSVITRYDSLGNKISVENSLGHATTYSDFNGQGLPGTVTGPNGDVKQYLYDARGRAIRVRTFINGVAADTTDKYNGQGLLSSTVTADGREIFYQYDDARRLIVESERLAPSKYALSSYDYDLASNVVAYYKSQSSFVPGSSIRGHIDGISDNGAGSKFLVGWACSSHMSEPISVHMYVGGSAGIGTMIGSYSASMASEEPVARACETLGTAHRFSIPLDQALSQNHGGKLIYIHGISPAGSSNSLIGQSGTYAVPGGPPNDPDPPNPPCLPGQICQDPLRAIKSSPPPPGPLGTDVYGTFTDYDELGRVRARSGSAGQHTRYEYDLNGNLIRIRDSENRVTHISYDALDRVTKIVDPTGGQATYEYDLAGTLSRIVDAKGGATSYTYDGFGQLWSANSPDTGTTNYSYSSDGLRTSMTRSSGQSTTYGYDALGRITHITSSGASKVLSYDNCPNGKGMVCGVADPYGELGYAYNAQGSVTAQSQRIGTSSIDFGQAYVYDSVGRLTGISYPGGVSAGYAYVNGRLAAMTVGIGGVQQTVATQFESLPHGPVRGWTFGNGLKRATHYDPDGRLTELSTIDGASFVQRLTYEYTSHNEIRQIYNHVDSSNTKSYAYDALSRLVSESKNSSTYTNFTYDANGNRASVSGAMPGVMIPPTSYQIQAAGNRLAAVGQNQITYNSTGGMTSGFGRTISYDQFNRISQIANSSGTHSYWVNALGQRTLKQFGTTGQSTGFLYGQSGQVEAEFSWGSGMWTHYLRLPSGQPIGFVRGGQWYAIHTDHMGRPEAATNSARSVVWRSNNSAFGRIVTLDAVGGLNIGFPGQYWDEETSLWYNNARTYDPAIGRYLESDPLGQIGGSNTYSYALNNPVNANDPTGLIAYICQRGTSVGIAIPIYFAKGSDPGDVARVVAAIERGWTGRFGNFNVVTRVLVEEGGWNSAINLVNFKEGSGRSAVNGYNHGIFFTDTYYPNDWDYVHEAGHFLGLADTYDDPMWKGIPNVMGDVASMRRNVRPGAREILKAIDSDVNMVGCPCDKK